VTTVRPVESAVDWFILSSFSREYKRLFDPPPLREVERLREAAGENAFA
jgi:hypothetical protein